MSGWDGSFPEAPRCEVRAPDCKGKYKKRTHENDMEINRGNHVVRACSNPLCQIGALDTVRKKIEHEESARGEVRSHNARSVS